MTINRLNGKMYVGRDSKRQDDYFGSGVLIKQAIEKHGIENFSKIILEDLGPDAALKDAIDAEKRWIALFQAPANPMFYNLSWDTGGMGKGDTHSEETKALIREKMKEVYKAGLPPRWRENVARARVGRVPWNKGKTKSDMPEGMYKRRQNRRFSDQERSEIVRGYAEGIPAYKLAQRWECSHHTILRIVKKEG